MLRREIALLAGPRDWGETRESWLARVPQKVPTVSYRTIKAIWYGEIRSENHWAARDIKRAVAIIEAQRDSIAHIDRLQSLICGLEVLDPNFHEPTIAIALDRLRKLRGENRS